MININHIREQILSDFKNVNADIVEPLTYIRSLTDPKGKILLIYKRVRIAMVILEIFLFNSKLNFIKGQARPIIDGHS